MRRKFFVAISVVGASLALTASAQAVTFDPATGTGDVSKGEVQSGFGWNDPEFQNYADRVTFRYRLVGRYVCPDGTRSTLSTGRELIAPVQKTNPNGHVQGFELTGWGATLTSRGLDCGGRLIRQRQELNARVTGLPRTWLNQWKAPES
jgi:hypothetical protein